MRKSNIALYVLLGVTAEAVALGACGGGSENSTGNFGGASTTSGTMGSTTTTGTATTTSTTGTATTTSTTGTTSSAGGASGTGGSTTSTGGAGVGGSGGNTTSAGGMGGVGGMGTSTGSTVQSASATSVASSSSGGLDACGQACAHAQMCFGFDVCTPAMFPTMCADATQACVGNCVSATPCNQLSQQTLTTCQAQCQPPPPDAGSDAGSDAGGSPALCSQCAQNSCGQQVGACLQNASCSSWLQCAQGCSTPSCFFGCDAQFPAGKAQYDAIYTCTCSSCLPECGSVADPCNANH